jgi:enoyl-CoA hydratase/carnithine racemase
MSDTDLVRLDLRDHVATLTLDDARRRNAMTPALGDALRDAVESLRGNRMVRAVVLTGAGEVFSAGGDLKMLERLRTEGFKQARDFMLDFYARYLHVTTLEVPVIAAVRGAAIGAGLCVAMACDLCVVDERARLALNFVRLGLHPGMGATYLTPHRVGAQRAAELLLTGRYFDGAEAARMGMCLEAVAGDEVLGRAQEIAQQIAANAPLAVRALTAELRLDRVALQRALHAEAFHQAESYSSRDLGEGLAAAVDRRAASFVGE